MSNHLPYAVVSGLLVAGAWVFTTPLSEILNIGPVEHAGGGFVLGVFMYVVIAVAHAADKRRASA